MLNDYYAVSLSNINVESQRKYIERMLKNYSSAYVAKLHLSIDYSPEITIASHLVKYQTAIKALLRSAPKNLDLKVVHTVPILVGISKIPDIEKLTVTHNNKNYLYIRLPVHGMSNEEVIHEIHHLLYKRHIVPIILSAESIGYYLDEKLAESIFNIPNAIYEINFTNIHQRETKILFKTLVRKNKTVIFGSADKFDAFIFANSEYYIKHMRSALGDEKYMKFILAYRKLFS